MRSLASVPVGCFWEAAYALGLTPWDTGEVPPEVKRVVADGTVRAPGRALDIGCGTGTNSLFLARQGLDVLGVDVSRVAVRRARARVARAEVAARFRSGDVTRLHLDDDPAPQAYNFMLDIGCFHGLDEPLRASYLHMVDTLLARPGILMQYIRLAGTNHAPAMAEEAVAPAPSLRPVLSRRYLLVLLSRIMRPSRPPYPARREIESAIGAVCRLISVEEGWEQGQPSAWVLWQRD